MTGESFGSDSAGVSVRMRLIAQTISVISVQMYRFNNRIQPIVNPAIHPPLSFIPCEYITASSSTDIPTLTPSILRPTFS